MNNFYEVADEVKHDKIGNDLSELYEPFLEGIFVESISLADSQAVGDVTFFNGLPGSRRDSEKTQFDTFGHESGVLRLAKLEGGATGDLTRDIAAMLKRDMAIGQMMAFTIHMPQFGRLDVNAVNTQSAFLVNIKTMSLSLRKLLKSRDRQMAEEIGGCLGKRTKVRVVGNE